MELVGRHVRVRPIVEDDYATLHAYEMAPGTWERGRLRGFTPSAHEFIETLWANVSSHLMIEDIESVRPYGYCTFYNPSESDRYVFFALLAFEGYKDRRRSVRTLEGAFLAIDDAFTASRVRKLYMEVAEFNLGQFASGVGRLLEEVLRLKEHLYYRGRYWDQIILELSEERWELERKRFMPYIVGGASESSLAEPS